MKVMTQVVRALAFALIVFPAVPAFAEQQRGFYIGASIGETDADISVGEIDDIIREAFRINGSQVVSMASSIDTKDSNLYVFLGYRILKWLSVEGGYIDLGGTRYTSDGLVFSPGFGALPFNAVMEIDNKGAVVNALGHLPLSDYFDIHGRLGFFSINTDVTATITGDSRYGSASDSTVSVAVQAGLGVAVHLGNHFSLSADWTHFLDVGNGDDGDEDDEDSGYDSGFDVDVVNVSAIVRF